MAGPYKGSTRASRGVEGKIPEIAAFWAISRVFPELREVVIYEDSLPFTPKSRSLGR